ncbi:MAG: TonB-dependent receptor, partial [Bacteroidia bacterium]
GVEFTVEKYFSEGYYYLGTLSLYESKYKASDNKWRNTAFNGNFVLNVLAGKEWKIGKNNMLSASGKITYAGGKRFVPIDEVASLKNGYEVQIEDRSYENRLKDFFRADIRIAYKTNSKRVTQEYGLDIQNITNRKNIFTQQYNPQTGKVEDLYQIGLFPVPFYRIYF